MLQEKYIGLILAMSSSIFIGLSFVITKKGLNSSRKRHGKQKKSTNFYYAYSYFFRRISSGWSAPLSKELDLVGWYRNKYVIVCVFVLVALSIYMKTKHGITVAVGEILNFSAYSFAPPILVTPLGALSVILG
jgi:hypothetical protein